MSCLFATQDLVLPVVLCLSFPFKSRNCFSVFFWCDIGIFEYSICFVEQPSVKFMGDLS